MFGKLTLDAFHHSSMIIVFANVIMIGTGLAVCSEGSTGLSTATGLKLRSPRFTRARAVGLTPWPQRATVWAAHSNRLRRIISA